MYLGRNFELKRKDYLHEEARQEIKQDGQAGSGIIPPEKLAQSIEYLIRDTEKIMRTAFESTMMAEGNEVDFVSYARYFKEVKTACIAYGEEHQMPKVKEAATQLKEMNIERIVYGRFPLLRRLVGFGGLPGMIYRLIRRALKSNKLQANLHANVSNLNKLLLYVQNVAYQEIM